MNEIAIAVGWLEEQTEFNSMLPEVIANAKLSAKAHEEAHSIEILVML